MFGSKIKKLVRKIQKNEKLLRVRRAELSNLHMHGLDSTEQAFDLRHVIILRKQLKRLYDAEIALIV